MDGADLSLGSLSAPHPAHPKRSEVRPAGVHRERVQAAKPQAAKPQAKSRAKPVGLMWSGLAGFVAGAICWHFVGFWGFMTEAVFHARPDGSAKSVQRMTGASAKNQNRQPGAVAATAAANASCSLAAMDRSGGDIQPRGCEGHTYKFHPSRQIARADRGDFGPTPVPTLISGEATGAVAVGGWSARVETSEQAGTEKAGTKLKKAD